MEQSKIEDGDEVGSEHETDEDVFFLLFSSSFFYRMMKKTMSIFYLKRFKADIKKDQEVQ